MRETMRRVREKRIDLLWITIGTFLMAVATNLFYTPAHMVPGGFTGLAIILKHLTEKIMTGGIPVWLTNIVLNVPLILMSVKIRGFQFIRKTFFAALIFSLFLYIVPEYALISDDLFLVSMIGGVVMGAGLGFVFQGKATTGGTDTLAAILQYYLPHISVARIMPVLDGMIILLSAWIFGIPLTLYAVISVFLMGRVADRLTTGMRNANLFYIISDQYVQISQAIMDELDRGVTRLDATGMYTDQSRVVLMCAVSRKQTVMLRDIVADIDPDAFMILADAREIRGEGFLQYTKEEL